MGVRVPADHYQNPTVTNCVIINQGKELHFSLAVQASKGVSCCILTEEGGAGTMREEERVSEQGREQWGWVDRGSKKAGRMMIP